MLVEYDMTEAQAEFLDQFVLGANPAKDLLIANYPTEVTKQPKTKVRGQIPNSLIHFVEDDLCT